MTDLRAKQAHERIYLQVQCQHDGDYITWCQDRIHDTDVEYIRIDLHTAALAAAEGRVRELEERLEIGYAYNLDGERVAVDKDFPDGIECRDLTIKAQDQKLHELTARVTALEEAVKALPETESGTQVRTVVVTIRKGTRA